jgi:DNA invertase Pin-like site-specific DNA recombinase
MKRLSTRIKNKLTKKNLKALRKSGLTYKEIGRKFGMSVPHIYYYANKLGIVKHA